ITLREGQVRPVRVVAGRQTPPSRAGRKGEAPKLAERGTPQRGGERGEWARMKRRAVTEVSAAAEEAAAAPTRAATDQPLAVGAEAEDTELDEPLPDAEHLVAEAVALTGDDLDTARLIRRYWRFAPDEELVGLSCGEMVEAAREHRTLAEQRVPGELKLSVDETADGELTRIMVVTDDMPFLVDTVTATLASRDLSVHLLVHPLMVVRREP